MEIRWRIGEIIVLLSVKQENHAFLGASQSQSFWCDINKTKCINYIPELRELPTEENVIFQLREGHPNCLAFNPGNMKWQTHSRIQNIQFKYLLSSFPLYLITAFTALPEFATDTVHLCWEILNISFRAHGWCAFFIESSPLQPANSLIISSANFILSFQSFAVVICEQKGGYLLSSL